MTEIIFITSLAVLFIYMTFQKGMIFSYIAEELKFLPEWIKKPLFTCPICMSIWYGAVILKLGYYAGTWAALNWFECIITLFAVGGLNSLYIYVIELGKSISKTLNDYECNCIKKEDKELERKERIYKLVAKNAGLDKKQ